MMDFNQLLKGDDKCACGRVHKCPVDHVVIGSGAVGSLTKLAEEYHHILLVADSNTYEAQGWAVDRLLRGKLESQLIYSGETVLVPDEETIAYLEESVTTKTDLIIGVGSGVINDLCKYVSFQKNLPYFIVATAPSMDGYASNNAALILGGMKISPNARPPKAIIADTQILKNAPMDMIQAGFGDIMGKLSCLNDWKLSKLVNHEYFCEKVYRLTYDTVMELMPLAGLLLERDETAVGMLMEALVTVGVAMSFVGNSRPASGSEHHLSHFFEITGIVQGRPYLPHGIDVAFSAVLTAMLRERILHEQPVMQSFDRECWVGHMHRIYGTVASGVIQLQDNLDSYCKYARNAMCSDWNEIRKCLSEAPSVAQMLEIVESVGLHYADFEAFYTKSVLEDAIKWGKDLKDRYTVLWLYNGFYS